MKAKSKRLTVMMIILSLFVLCVNPGNTKAYAYDHTFISKYWNDNYLGPSYRIQTTFGATTKTQIQTAMDEWNQHLPYTNFLFVSAISTTDSVASKDSIQTITKYAYGGDGFTAQNLAYVTNGKVLETDIEVNSSLSWANSKKPNYYDIQSTMTHELGHSLMIYHSDTYANTMYHTGFPNTDHNRTLTADDIAAAQDSYARWTP